MQPSANQEKPFIVALLTRIYALLLSLANAIRLGLRRSGDFLFVSKNETLAQKLVEQFFQYLFFGILAVILTGYVQGKLERHEERQAFETLKNEQVKALFNTLVHGFEDLAGCLDDPVKITSTECGDKLQQQRQRFGEQKRLYTHITATKHPTLDAADEAFQKVISKRSTQTPQQTRRSANEGLESALLKAIEYMPQQLR